MSELREQLYEEVKNDSPYMKKLENGYEPIAKKSSVLIYMIKYVSLI